MTYLLLHLIYMNLLLLLLLLLLLSGLENREYGRGDPLR
jgi:hypothetical protein